MTRKRAAALVAALTLTTLTACGVTEPTKAVEMPDKYAGQPEEDSPDFDCRLHRNLTCGVTIEGDGYVVTFDEDGRPLTITERGW